MHRPFPRVIHRGSSPAMVAMLLAALSAGCGPKQSMERPTVIEQSDPSLEQGALRAGKIVLVGVVGKELKDPQEATLTSEWERAFASKRKDLPVLSAGAAEESLGHELRTQILAEYRSKGSVDTTLLIRADESMAGAARYLAVVRVYDDQVTQGREAINPDDGSSDNVRLTTAREIVFQSDLWDLATGWPVWSGMVKSGGQAQAEKWDPNEDEGSSIGDWIGNILLGFLIKPKPPKAPKIEDMARNAFESLVEKIPK